MMRNCTKAVLLVGFCSYAARWSRRLPFKNSLIRARVAQKSDICDQKKVSVTNLSTLKRDTLKP